LPGLPLPGEHSIDYSAAALARVEVAASIDSSAPVPLLAESEPSAHVERPIDENARSRPAKTQALLSESPEIQRTLFDDAEGNSAAEAGQDVAQESTQQPDSQQVQPEKPQRGTDVDMQALMSSLMATGQHEPTSSICVELLSIQNQDHEAIKINMTSTSKIKDLRAAVKEVMGFDDRALRQLRLLKKKGNVYLTLSDDEPVRQKVYLHHPDILMGGISPQPSVAQQSGQQQGQTRHVKNLKHDLPLGVDAAVLGFTQLMFDKMTDEEREAWNDLPRHVIWIMWFDMLGAPLFVKCADQQFRESVFGLNFEKKAPITLAKSDPVLKEYAFHKRKLISVWFTETGTDVTQQRSNANLLFDFDELDDMEP